MARTAGLGSFLSCSITPMFCSNTCHPAWQGHRERTALARTCSSGDWMSINICSMSTTMQSLCLSFFTTASRNKEIYSSIYQSSQDAKQIASPDDHTCSLCCHRLAGGGKDVTGAVSDELGTVAGRLGQSLRRL